MLTSVEYTMEKGNCNAIGGRINYVDTMSLWTSD